MKIQNQLRRCRFAVTSLVIIAFFLFPVATYAATIMVDLPGPTSSVRFGTTVTVLSNGNFVVTDPSFNIGAGAVYLYNPDRVLISRLTSTLFNNNTGGGGITVLANGNFVVSSPHWSSSVVDTYMGAVTWCSQVTGCDGTISAANSLVGNHKNDGVGGGSWGGVFALANGNYVVTSPDWDYGAVSNVGAVTWGNGTSGTSGAVSESNSLVGSHAEDVLGSDFYGGITCLTNGNYLVRTSSWDNGSIANAGAVTWGDGTSGTSGVVSPSNSLVGGHTNDAVGDDMYSSVIELTNGNYVVSSEHWDLDDTNTDVGAVTWGNGVTGTSGTISSSNSLVGTSNNAPVGDSYLDSKGVTPLVNGNYVVSSPYWASDGSASHYGAVTWSSGITGVSGTILSSNSLVGSAFGEYVGYDVIALTNGNYVVSSPDWGSYRGAVTWGDGTVGISGPVSDSNSLVGAPSTLVAVGDGGVTALKNGNYVVSTPAWYSSIPSSPSNVGAVTWGNGTGGTTGLVSTANSLVGGYTYASIGDEGVIALENGNYVVVSRSWDNGGTTDVGAVTWVNGAGVTTGVVSTSNSLIGSTASDQVGYGVVGGSVTALANGNYVVASPKWDNGSIVNAGAITWGNGASGTTGVVSDANSLAGGTSNEQVGGNGSDGGVFALKNGNYVVSIPQWDNGGDIDVGAVAWGNGAGGTVGFVSSTNSLVGSTTDDAVGSGSFFGAAGITVLPDGNYIVNSPKWNDGTHAGAVTWGDGLSGTTGILSDTNSLVNTSANDVIFSDSAISVFPDGSVAMHFPNWSDGSNDGAVSLISGPPGSPVGPLSSTNSVIGSAALRGDSLVSDYDTLRAQLFVGRPYDNKVSILRSWPDPSHWLYLPVTIK